MGFNSTKDYIWKVKKDNINIEYKKNIIRIENNCLFIKYGIRNYQIEFSNLVNVTEESTTQYISSGGQNSFVDKRIYTLFIRVVYIKNKKIKILELPYKKIIEKPTFSGPYKTKGEKIYFEEESIKKLMSYFITKKQIEDNPDLKYDENYMYIRTNDENDAVENLIDKKVIRFKKEIKSFIIQLFVILIFIIAVPIVVALIYKLKE